MARKKGGAVATKAAGTDVVVVTPPAAAPIQRRRRVGGRRRSPRRRRRGGYASRVGSMVMSEKHTITAVGSALALGLLQRTNIKIPSVAGLSPQAVAGLASFVYARMTKSLTAAHVATGLLSVAAYEFGAGKLPEGTVIGEYGQGYVIAPETYEPYPGTAAVMMGDDEMDGEEDEDEDY